MHISEHLDLDFNGEDSNSHLDLQFEDLDSSFNEPAQICIMILALY